MSPDELTFDYQPECGIPDCPEAARFKIAAPWSDGTSRELKNYGVSCERHIEDLLARARKHRLSLRLAEGETVGEVSVYPLVHGQRDRDLLLMQDKKAR